MRWRAVVILLTIASAVSVHVGLYSGIRSLYWTRDSINEELGFADLQIHFVPEDLNNFPSLDALAGVDRMERRLLFPGVVETPGGARLSAQMVFLERPSPALHQLRFIEGRPFRADAPNEVVVERSLASYHGYKIGDAIDVKVGERIYDGTIVGIAFSPEFLVAASNPDYYVPEKGSLAVVYANLSIVSDPLGFTLVNDLLFGFEPGSDPEAAKREILRRLDKLNIDHVVTRERQFGYKHVETQLTAIAHFVPTMVILLLTLASIITFINFSRLIATERREIGALMALGYDRSALLRSYFEGALLLGLLGSALGLVLSFAARDVFAEICADSMGMSVVRTISVPPLMLRGFFYGLLVTCVSAIIPVMRLFRLPLYEIIRETSRPIEKARWGSRLALLPSSFRYGIRNLIRQRGRALATLMSIALALGVASAYRVSAKSIDETLTRRFENDRWDLAVDFLYPLYLDEAEEIGVVGRVESMAPYLRHYVELEHEGRYADAVVFGIEAALKMTAPPFVEGREAAGEREVVLSGGLAKKLEIGVGGVVHAEVLGRAHRFDVVGVTSDVVADLATMSLSTAQEIFELPDKVTGAQLRVTAADHEVEAALLRLDSVGKVFRKSQFLVQMRAALSVMISVLDLAAAVNILIGILFVLTSINLSILETEGEFATLKAIGYGNGSLARIVFTESVALAIGAAFLSLPVGELTSVYLNARMSEAWFAVDNFLLPLQFGQIVVPALFLIPLGAIPGFRHVVRLDISKVLRTRTIE